MLAVCELHRNIIASEVSPQITPRPNESIGNGVYEVKASPLINAIMQILSSLRQIGGLGAIFFFLSLSFSSGSGEGAHRASGIIRKPRRARISTTTLQCNLRLSALQRGSTAAAAADRCGRTYTRIIAKSRTQVAPARPSMRFTRAPLPPPPPLLSSIIYFPPPILFSEYAAPRTIFCIHRACVVPFTGGGIIIRNRMSDKSPRFLSYITTSLKISWTSTFKLLPLQFFKIL